MDEQGHGGGRLTSGGFEARSFDRSVRALVVGATGGIGSALVEQLLESSSVSTVFAGGRHLDRVRGRWPEQERDGRVRPVELDVASEASVERAATQVGAETDRLDLIINATGLLHAQHVHPEKRLSQLDPETLLQSFRINSVGPLLVAKHFVGLLPRREHSVFASLSARVGSIGDNRLGGWYSYRSSKAALNMLTRSLAVELARSRPGCLCVVLHPGTVDTGLSEPFQSGVAAQKLFSPERAAAQLLAVMDGLGEGDSGKFFAWDGEEIAW